MLQHCNQVLANMVLSSLCSISQNSWLVCTPFDMCRTWQFQCTAAWVLLHCQCQMLCNFYKNGKHSLEACHNQIKSEASSSVQVYSAQAGKKPRTLSSLLTAAAQIERQVRCKLSILVAACVVLSVGHLLILTELVASVTKCSLDSLGKHG